MHICNDIQVIWCVMHHQMTYSVQISKCSSTWLHFQNNLCFTAFELVVCFALFSGVFPCEFEQLRFRFVYLSLTGLTNRGTVLLKQPFDEHTKKGDSWCKMSSWFGVGHQKGAICSRRLPSLDYKTHRSEKHGKRYKAVVAYSSITVVFENTPVCFVPPKKDYSTKNPTVCIILVASFNISATYYQNIITFFFYSQIFFSYHF